MMYDGCFLRLPVGLSAGLLLATVGCDSDVAKHDNPRGAEDPVAVSAAVMVDPAPVPVPVPGAWPAAAFGENQYLVVWEDQRTQRPVLFGGRVAADGTALDAHGFPLLDPGLGSGVIRELQPVAAFDGDNFLVVIEVAGQIVGVRVSPAGEVLDPGGFVIASSASPTSRPSLVFDGEQHRVAWSVGRKPVDSEDGVYAARVTRHGTVLDGGGVRVHGLEAEMPTPVSVSFDGSNLMLSWIQTRDDVEAIRVAPDGTPIDAAPIAIEPRARCLSDPGTAAGFDGTNHVIAWVSEAEGEEGWRQHRLMASRVTREGTVLDPHGIALDATSSEFVGVHRLEMVAGGGRSIAVWSRHDIRDGFAWTDRTGVVQLAADGTIGLHPVDRLAAGLEATLVTHPDGGLLLWRDGDDLESPHTSLVGARLEATGAPVADSVVVPASITNRQELIAAASGEQGFFVLWLDTRNPSGKGPVLVGAPLAADGTPLDVTPTQFTDHPVSLADVVFDGANYVVAWGDENGRVVATRVSPVGERLEPRLQSLLRAEQFVATASDGTNTLLIGAALPGWGDLIWAVLLNQAGAVVGNIMRIHGAPHNGPRLALDATASFDGTGYLVVWHDSNTVFGRRISTAGALEGRHFSIAESSDVLYLATAGGDGNHLVVRHDINGIAATRVSADGEIYEVGSLVAELQPSCCHSVAFDGHSFIVGWRGIADLHATRVSAAGEVVQQFAISQAPGPEGRPVLAGANGRALAAYSAFVPGPPYDQHRALARIITP